MALRLIMGHSGSGKTRFLFEYALKEADLHPDRNYLIIVPEQFTLSTQRELIRLSDKHGILNVDVLSFNRLAYRIFEEVGFKDLTGSALDDMGKNLILMHVASALSEKLTVFSGNINKLGYITEIKSAISELMQYGISPEKLNEMIAQSEKNGKKLLSKKLGDINILYEAFNAFIKDKYITTEEVLTKAASACIKSKKLTKSVVLFDGFTGFTPVQYALIEALLKITLDMQMTILTDLRDNYDYNKEHELFYLGFKTKEKLYSIAKNNNIRIENEYVIKDEIPVRFLGTEKLNNSRNNTNPMLIHLERNIFRNHSKRYISDTDVIEKPTKTVSCEISLFSALQPIDEITKIAVEIQKIIQSGEGIRYKDIAIATADIENYIPIFRRIFKLYNIPYFIDRSQPVLLNPFIEFVRSLIDIIADNFSYNAVFRFLRSPLCLFDKDEIDVLDNFVLAKGIKGYSAWKDSFAEKYGCNSKITSKFNLNTLDIIREKMLELLNNVTNLITDGNEMPVKIPTISVNAANQALINTFEYMSIENKLNDMLDDYKITDDIFENNHKFEYENIYKNTVVLLNTMSELLGDEIISIKEYGDLLNAGFDEIRIGIIPTITDYIQIGDTTRSRFNDIQVLFIVGANDANIPGNNSSSGIISDIEKEFLLDNIPDIELAPTARVKAYTCRLYLYMLMTKPKNRLYISYSRLNSENESVRPSYIIKVLTDMFPNLSVETDSGSLYDVIYNSETMYGVLSENVRNENFSDLIKMIISESKNPEKDVKKLKTLIDCAFMDGVLKGNDEISKAVANVLYGKALTGSVTRLEQYAKCAFKYYLEYGLSLKERDVFSFDSKDMGTVFHESLEKYSAYLSKNGIKWTDIDDAKRNELVKQSVYESIDEEIGSVINSSFRNKYMLERITGIVDKSVEILTKQLDAGCFDIKSCELSFSSTDTLGAFTFRLSDDEILKLSGKVDRLDTYETENNVYIKVIDYKSGDLSFDLLEVYRGLKLQLVVYMNACRELMEKEYKKEVIPAGILYYHLDYPVVEGSLFTEEEIISDVILKSLRMKGLVNSDEDVYRLMDKNFATSSYVIPIKVNKDGSLAKSSSAVSTDDFNVICDYVNKKICDMGREILSGNIKAGENITDKSLECRYCPYTDACSFYMFNNDAEKADDKVINTNAGLKHGRLGYNAEVSKENVIEIMREEVGNG